jgi:3-aminobutyryl-CoA ammonia-lyase
VNEEKKPGEGLKVVLRLRMSSHDAHYGGNLVDGARMLGLFGDVATELLIRLDGDEGLFRAYDSVDFLAPVYAGDYVEAEGVITAVGKTSRKMAFEARKVIRSAPLSGRPGRAGRGRCARRGRRSGTPAPAGRGARRGSARPTRRCRRAEA